MEEIMTMNAEELLLKIQEDAKSQDDTRIYFALKTMRFKPVRPQHLIMVKIILSCRKNGINIINNHLLLSILERVNGKAAILGTLHNLGDKKVLTYLREENTKGNKIRWTLSPEFMKAYGEDLLG